MPAPFNIDDDSPAPSDLISAFPANEQDNRALIEEWLTFISDPATGIIRESALPPTLPAPAGTRMLFLQTAAPTGWTKETSAAYNNAALRIVTGSITPTAGTVDFTTAFASQTVAGTVAATVLAEGHLPPHQHFVSGNTGFISADHTHGVVGSGGTDVQGTHTHPPGAGSFYVMNTAGGNTSTTGGNNSILAGTTGAAGAHSHNVSISGSTGGVSANHFHAFSAWSSVSGSGIGHAHGFTGTPINLAVKYADSIVATKDA